MIFMLTVSFRIQLDSLHSTTPCPPPPSFPHINHSVAWGKSLVLYMNIHWKKICGNFFPEIRRRLEELGRRPQEKDNSTEELLRELREQEARNQRLLDELRRQLAEARRPINVMYVPLHLHLLFFSSELLGYLVILFWHCWHVVQYKSTSIEIMLAHVSSLIFILLWAFELLGHYFRFL